MTTVKVNIRARIKFKRILCFSKINRINTHRQGSQLATISIVSLLLVMLQILLAFQGSQGSHSTNKHPGTVAHQLTANYLSHILLVISSCPEASLGLYLIAHNTCGILNRLFLLFDGLQTSFAQ